MRILKLIGVLPTLGFLLVTIGCSSGQRTRNDSEGPEGYRAAVGSCQGCGAAVYSSGCASALTQNQGSGPLLSQIESQQDLTSLASASASQRLVVQFSIPGCGACVVQSRSLAALANQSENQNTTIVELKLAEDNLDTNEIIAQMQLDSAFPQIRVFEKGQVVLDPLPPSGLLTDEQLKEILQ